MLSPQLLGRFSEPVGRLFLAKPRPALLLKQLRCIHKTPSLVARWSYNALISPVGADGEGGCSWHCV